MRVLLALLLIGIVGCGGEDNSPDEGAAPSSPAVTPVKAENAEADGPKRMADKPPAQTAAADPVAALQKLGALIRQDDQGEVFEVYLAGTKITDAGLVHLKGLTNLQKLIISGSITDAGVADLQKALPNCEISK